ncbi:MAG: hypothetical protein COT74_06160 [Bdellovibrionales bacterium CG10_big_fil_rev_8_21_14_0_10_45_34]|nr:MAG: hypothetical protein COT74_06160 [Bdellovibrionales bacterium CG10_big_fil_rev_8_21_14_0_10_45_34]
MYSLRFFSVNSRLHSFLVSVIFFLAVPLSLAVPSSTEAGAKTDLSKTVEVVKGVCRILKSGAGVRIVIKEGPSSPTVPSLFNGAPLLDGQRGILSYSKDELFFQDVENAVKTYQQILDSSGPWPQSDTDALRRIREMVQSHPKLSDARAKFVELRVRAQSMLMEAIEVADHRRLALLLREVESPKYSVGLKREQISGADNSRNRKPLNSARSEISFQNWLGPSIDGRYDPSGGILSAFRLALKNSDATSLYLLSEHYSVRGHWAPSNVNVKRVQVDGLTYPASYDDSGAFPWTHEFFNDGLDFDKIIKKYRLHAGFQEFNESQRHLLIDLHAVKLETLIALSTEEKVIDYLTQIKYDPFLNARLRNQNRIYATFTDHSDFARAFDHAIMRNLSPSTLNEFIQMGAGLKDKKFGESLATENPQSEDPRAVLRNSPDDILVLALKYSSKENLEFFLKLFGEIIADSERKKEIAETVWETASHLRKSNRLDQSNAWREYFRKLL